MNVTAMRSAVTRERRRTRRVFHACWPGLLLALSALVADVGGVLPWGVCGLKKCWPSRCGSAGVVLGGCGRDEKLYSSSL